MPLDVNIVGRVSKEGIAREVHVHPFQLGNTTHNGIIALTQPFIKLNPEVHPFINPTVGSAMNQNVSFGGTPEIIHNGGTSTEWTGAALAGTWNFADSGKTTITDALNNDAATFSEETPTTVDWANFTAFSGKIDLDAYDPDKNTITIQWDLAGVSVGDAIVLDDAIDTADFSEQSFAIPKAAFNFASTVVDGFTITINRTGGTKPTIKFDDMQMEETGSPITFKSTTPRGTFFHVTEIRLGIADNISAIVTGSTTTYPTAPGLSYDKILGVSELATGLIFTRVQSGEVQFSISFKKLGDFLAAGSNVQSIISDGTNTFVSLAVEFPEPIILNGSKDDFISFTVNDDLSGLLEFTASARGALEV